MSVFIKICGICSRKDLEQICALEPDAVGFVFYPDSKRYVRPEQVAGWFGNVPEKIRRVGVFVEPAAEEAEEIARICHLDVIQIHMRSNDWKLDRPLFEGLEVWLAPRIGAAPGKEVLRAVSPAPEILLVDSFDPEKIGGTGKPVDFETALAARKQFNIPVMLAGGLTPGNVCDAIEVVQPWGVDVSSGVEIEPGVKDIRAVKQFIWNVRK
ncbi:MAG: phosphoribosylanthranilate isomerase [Kiritimatiellales bacterium]